MTHRRLVLLQLVPLLSCVATGLAADAQELYTNRLQQVLPLSNIANPGSVERARLFVTTDNGKTWTMQHELQVAPDAKEAPKFTFNAPHDGAYGLMPCTTYRNGTAEPEPKPGQAPNYILIVDTVAPTIASFDGTLIGRSANKAIVRVTWSVSDPYLPKEPIAIEASTNQDAKFITIHRGPKDGAMELMVPINPETKTIHLRVVVSDLARNVTISPSRKFDVMPVKPVEEPKPVAPADPAQALAQAAGTLPTLTEVGATPTRPLPTTEISQPSQENPAAITAPPSAPVVVARPQPTPQQPPATVVRPDIVVNGKPYVPTTAPASEPSVTTTEQQPDVVEGSNAVDQAYYKKLAELRGGFPDNPRTTNRMETKEPEAEPSKPSEPVDGRRAPASPGAVIVEDPVQTLTDARIAVVRGEIDEACDLYERLRFTSLGKTALNEQVHTLINNNRPRDAITAIMSAPVEIITAHAQLDHGKALLMTNRPDEVEAAVSRISTDSPEARPALLLIVKAYIAMGRTVEAKRGLDYLARGKDDVAAEARALRGR